MLNRIGIVVLILLCAGLLIAVVAVKKRSAEVHKQDIESIQTFSNKWATTNTKLDEQKDVAATLQKDIDAQKKTFESTVQGLSNNLTLAAANLEKTEASLKASQEEITRKDAKITDLQAENEALDKKAAALTAQIGDLNGQITDTQKKLAASEGDRAFLQTELKRLMSQKAELERQFNDLTIVRAQVAKLKEEQAIARRVEWMRQGLYANSEMKGAQRLVQGTAAPGSKSPRPNYDLNVEVSSDGSLKVISPTNSVPATNRPAPR